MSDLYTLTEKPEAEEIVMIAGWRQWADGGSISSGLPQYLIDQHDARKIGEISIDDYYLFQLPGAQHFLRPLVRHKDGYTESLHNQRNEFYYTEVDGKGIIIFLGDEPHMNVERYIQTFLAAAKELNVSRVYTFGGVYAQVPYDKERHIHAIYSNPEFKDELLELSIGLSNYQGPASITSYLCKRADEQNLDVIGMYTFNPMYQFGSFEESSKSIHIENDYMGWLGVMQRVNHMQGLKIDLSDLENLSEQMILNIDHKVEQLDRKYPELMVQEFFDRLRDDFEEQPFSPLEDIWEEELRRLGDQFFPSDDE